ncbi:MAG: hypothetical protein EKK48_02360 [Candidatus Melainabacteria bacterium]|nr:MAG: hypothetical protein EKK48_02360 [Candidatus Melainabacteria bacterium]
MRKQSTTIADGSAIATSCCCAEAGLIVAGPRPILKLVESISAVKIRLDRLLRFIRASNLACFNLAHGTLTLFTV